MKRFMLWAAMLAAVAACGDSDLTGPSPEAAGANASRFGGSGNGNARSEAISVLTRNLYVGANIDVILAVQDPFQIPFVAAEAWAAVQATDFAARAQALADEVAATRPHLIGLQEVSLFRIQSPGDAAVGGTTPATDVALDFLAILMDALADRGLAYTVAAQSSGFDVELPVVTATGLDDIRLTDSEVILVRSDVGVSDVEERNFKENLVVPIPGGAPVTVLRGWTALTAEIVGHRLRFVSTHLEPAETGPGIQAAQAAELLEELGDETLPVLLVGDLNSAADGSSTPTYATLLGAGFADVWLDGEPRGVGNTCCQADDLQNPSPELFQRIDYILLRDPFAVRDGHLTGATHAQLVGEEPSDRTAAGLWPSDHAGVHAVLRLPARVFAASR
ncbi:MAG: endonuclease/exonuclease/phosphatase family protein [Acidobacteriota bacterium]